MNGKSFDAVKFMRDTRDELSMKYIKHPDSQERDLARIRKKFGKFKRTATNRRLKGAHSIISPVSRVR